MGCCRRATASRSVATDAACDALGVHVGSLCAAFGPLLQSKTLPARTADHTLFALVGLGLDLCANHPCTTSTPNTLLGRGGDWVRCHVNVIAAADRVSQLSCVVDAFPRLLALDRRSRSCHLRWFFCACPVCWCWAWCSASRTRQAADTPAGTEWIAKLRSGLWAAASRSPSSGVAPVSSSSAAGPGTPVPEQQGQQQPQQPVNERIEDMACDEASVEVLKRWLAIEKARKQSPCPKKQNVSWLLEHNRLH